MTRNCWPKEGGSLKKIGVLALQGAFIEHIQILNKLGVQTREVRLPEDLSGLDGLILPGGESTTMRKLAKMYHLVSPIQQFAKKRAVWGTCAGMILLAKEVRGEDPCLGLMDIVVERNAFGRQLDSFEENLYIQALENGKKKPFPAIFIRAPKLLSTKNKAKIIARLPDQSAVAAVEGKMLATAFHPELSEDGRLHEYFLNLAGK
ncbi:MAG: pyridoxal 5'-phosphate synthase glutaminase subunit PdxT [Proteobacteria bacterium]|nr:pyridoxal 5'-phosphate synthase glutaminase subunit PdxT [Pseudomonadota bacterium]MBU4317264.1 pyridoxal 5'-phosphate synthase glutaminase subunit PdxT [Pseudomonadota bacterium]MBU4471806.1 pyridoxal 5'-phosphate synthase glutaminase subunit PdxT [Pseudomonadota bacterium]